MIRWNKTWHVLRSRPRLWISLALGTLVFAVLPSAWAQHSATRALVAWNGFALLYLALAGHMAWRSGVERMRRRALTQDEGRVFVLVLVVVASVAVLLAIASQLGAVKDLHGLQKSRHVALAALTLVSSWLFTQTLFALHYAHDFYAARARHQPEGLIFPGTPDPDYADFLYFACVIGTSAQTADVSFTSAAMRRVGLVHCIQAFFFNTTVLALTINIAAGLF
jgi:uncharacterized membrane protein